jgi:hypothetical protein
VLEAKNNMPIKAKAKNLCKKLTKKRHGATDLFGSDRYSLMGDSNPNFGNTNLTDRQQYDGRNDGTTPAPTVAAFSPNQQTASRTRNQKSVLIHQKSPLLVATPPQVTRVLAHSHPFILPLNHLLGLVSWTTDDQWESFLFLINFWFWVLYGDSVLRWEGPVIMVGILIFGLYTRRYSPLSSTVWSDVKKARKRADSEQRKSLDEILDTLQTFTGRCEVLLDPFLRLTEYLSTQSSATSATTRPALTTLFIRILAFTPIWIALTLPPLRIITAQRIVLVVGTTFLTWHSRPARVTRTILWRSRAVRSTLSLLTGLRLPSTSTPPRLPPRPQDAAAAAKAGKAKSPGVTFTFSVFENERRWWGLGWTKSLLAYERQAWTDDQLNECPEPSKYTLPETDNETTKWRWVPDSEWKVEGALTEKEKSAKRVGGGGGGDYSGWTYYDNKWADALKEDGWGRYTRRRKWIRDAELVEVDPNEANTQLDTSSTKDFADTLSLDGTPTTPMRQRKGWFSGSGGTGSKPASFKKGPRQSDQHKSVDSISISGSVESRRSRDSAEEDVHTPLERFRQYDWDRSINEGLTEQLS